MTGSPITWIVALAPLLVFLSILAFGMIRKNKYNHKGWTERHADAIKTQNIQAYWELAQAKRLLLSLVLPWAANIIWRSFLPVTLSASGEATVASGILTGLLICTGFTSLYLVISAIYQLVIGWDQARETRYVDHLENKLKRLSQKEVASPFGENGSIKPKS